RAVAPHQRPGAVLRNAGLDLDEPAVAGDVEHAGEALHLDQDPARAGRVGEGVPGADRPDREALIARAPDRLDQVGPVGRLLDACRQTALVACPVVPLGHSRSLWKDAPVGKVPEADPRAPKGLVHRSMFWIAGTPFGA